MRARRQAAEHDDAWNKWLDRLDQRLEEERADLIEIVGLALGEALDDARPGDGQRACSRARIAAIAAGAAS